MKASKTTRFSHSSIQLSPDPLTSQLCPPVGLNPTDPDMEDENHITDWNMLHYRQIKFEISTHRMYKTDQCDNERENEKAQEGKKVVVMETDLDWLEIKSHP